MTVLLLAIILKYVFRIRFPANTVKFVHCIPTPNSNHNRSLNSNPTTITLHTYCLIGNVKLCTRIPQKVDVVSSTILTKLMHQYTLYFK